MKAVAGLLVVCVMVTVLMGCGRSHGPARYDLSGTVTYDNKPVPGGFIVFAPDASQGNLGPGTTATIDRGKYHTRPGQGTIGGPHIATISATDSDLDKIRKARGATKPKTLFSNIQMTADLPKEPAQHDFVVPVKK
jgi:hypothetical protein